MNYVKKSWLGQVSLFDAFWINFIGLSFMIVMMSAFFAGTIELIGRPIMISTLLRWVLCFAVLPWQAVGLWRTCENDINITGKSFWPRATQLILVLCIAYAAAGLFKVINRLDSSQQTTDQLTPGTDNKASSPPIAEKAYFLKILNGSTLYISGTLQKGIANEVEKILNGTPEVKQVMIKSSGGITNEGVFIAQSINKRKYKTFAFDLCLSTCTEVLAAGKYRVINAKAKIGFQKENDQDLKIYENTIFPFWRKQGINEAFIQDFTNKVLHSKDNEVWYPSHEYLIKMNFIHKEFDL
jgi:hypothetical protein